MNKAIPCGSRIARAASSNRKAPRFGRSEKPLVAASVDLRKKMSAIEEELTQVNGKSSEDFANYPVKLDSKFGALQNLADSADAAPTAAELAVSADLDQRLEAQLVKWREVLAKDLPAINDAMQKTQRPANRSIRGQSQLAPRRSLPGFVEAGLVRPFRLYFWNAAAIGPAQ